ncbi:putative RNA recognition motif domain, nucleotide-binding alpha-beta plait domain superfamily [Helianthus annuus]|nr:putative RNA recognition motif domain, nucleotide-binding alpha-beta plait domain superfamily [Helianthus annuus]
MAGKGHQVGNIIKFFVTNLPEGCTPWELRRSVEDYGDVTGTYVARKRDKQGSRFGFVSFAGVRDCQELLKLLGGVRMGDFKPKFNVARFAVENSGGSVEKEGKGHNLRHAGQNCFGGSFNVRDVRSYKEVVGSSSFGSGQVKQVTEQKVDDKVIVVPDRTGAFRNLHELALVGRARNLEALIDFDRLLKIAKVVVANFQYIGGLSLLITFHDEDSKTRFLDLKETLNLWFSKLDTWSGQSLPPERVAWLKLHGIPLHLLESDVLSQVGERFGKVLFVPKSFEEDHDLSVARVGVLVGSSKRIREEVTLRWKDRSFRIWVEEDPVDWIPDCFGRDSDSVSEGAPSSEYSPTDGMQVSGNGAFVEAQGTGNDGGAEKLPGSSNAKSHADPSPLHGENAIGSDNCAQERENGRFGVQVGLEKKWAGPRGELWWGKDL